jgi:hypothetical protein
MSMRPKVLTMLIAERVERDVVSGKTNVLGIFNGIAAGSFPVLHAGERGWRVPPGIHAKISRHS